MIDTIGAAKFVADCDIFKDLYGGRFDVPGLLRDMVDRGNVFYSE